MTDERRKELLDSLKACPWCGAAPRLEVCAGVKHLGQVKCIDPGCLVAPKTMLMAVEKAVVEWNRRKKAVKADSDSST